MTAVITGVGVVSPFGVGRQVFFDGLAGGGTAVGPIRSFDARSMPTTIAGEVPLPTIAAGGDAAPILEHLGRDASPLVEALARDGALRDRKIAFGLLAATEAWRHAGLGDSDADRRAHLVLGLGLEGAFLDDVVPILVDGAIRWDLAADAPLPATRFRTPVDACARACHRLLGLTGPTIVNASACAAGALAVAHAAALIARGSADVVVCGASDSMVNPLGIGGMSRLGAPSPRNTPDACRPFDRQRDGLVIGEGAAMFVVERADRARARGAAPLATIRGWGSTQDAYRATAPRPDGSAAAAAITRALARAALAPDDIGYVNAHGTGTPLNDPAECRALHRALGARAGTVPVSSIKGAVGHLMAAAGAIELAACVMALTRDLLPGTANLRERDPECDVDAIAMPQRRAVEHALSTSFGFGGQNAAVILGTGAVTPIAPVTIAAWAVRTPLGADVDRLVARLCAGERAARPNPHPGYRCCAIAPVVDAPPTSRHQRYVSRMGQHAIAAALEVMAGARGGPRVGVFAAVGGLRASWDDLVPAFGQQRPDGAGSWARGLRDIHPFWMLRHLSNNAHALLSADLGARGDGATYSGATAGASAIAGAARALHSGDIDTAVVIAYDSLLDPETLVELGEGDGWRDAPSVIAPYQDDSAGFVPGEAAAALLLVRDDTGTSSAGLGRLRAVDAAIIDVDGRQPRADALARTVARLGVDDITNTSSGVAVIDGAARGQPALDSAERRAIASVVDPRTPLTATTAALGQLGAATSVVQAIALAACLRRGIIAPIAGLRAASAGPLTAVTTATATSATSALALSTGVPGLIGAVHIEVSR